MNKLFTKIASISAGLSLAIGVGVALGVSKKDAVKAHAAMPSGYTLITTDNLSSLTTSDKVVIATDDGSLGVTGYSGSDATVAASGWLEFTVTNVDAANNHYSLKNADTNRWISLLAQNKFNISATSQTNLLATSDGRFSYVDSNSAQRWLAKNNSYYRCYTNGESASWDYFYVYIAPAQTGSISSVTVKGPNSETGTVTVSSGYENISTVQLSAVVESTGTIDTSVKWTVDDSTLAEVTSDGFVRLLKAGSPVVTATSKADDTKSGTITINASALVSYPESTDTGVFSDTSVWGTTTIAGGEFSGTLTNVSFADGGTPSGSTGLAYNKEGSMRVYNNTKLSLTTSVSYQIEYVVFVARSGTSFTNAPTSANGTVYKLEKSFVLDCSSSPSNSVLITFAGGTSIDTMSVYYSSTGSCGIVIDSLSGDLTKGDSGTFTATVTDATNPTVTWSSSDSSIVSVNSSTGVYSVAGYGDVTITADLSCDEGTAQASLVLAVNSGFITLEEANEICSALAEDEKTNYIVEVRGYITTLASSYLVISDTKLDSEGELDSEAVSLRINNSTPSYRNNYFAKNGYVWFTGKLQNYQSKTNQLVNASMIYYLDDAITFASNSYDVLNSACTAGPAGVTETQWNAIKTNWEALDSYAQAKLQAASSEDYRYSDSIGPWISRYTTIVEYGILEDFMELGILSNSRINNTNQISKTNNPTVFIVIISVLSISTLVGCVFVRKFKER